MDDDTESMCYLYVALQPLPRRPPAGSLRSRDSDPRAVPEVTEAPQAKGRQQPPHLLAQHPLCNHPALTLNLVPARGGGPAKPGSVLQHCLSMIQCLTSDQLTKFKIGITARPAHRWANSQFGYALEGYLSMQLLHCEPSSRACGFLEAALIAMLRGVSGCQNEALGGRVSA